MSHPPRPYPLPELSREVSGGLPVRDGVLQVFAPSFQDLVETQSALSAEELGQSPPGGEGDFATTLFELSALVAHVLGVYQDFYGGEAFLGTARTQQSLVRHGRRVGYTTDPGVAATGVVAIQVKDGLAGDIDDGLGLLSVPKGEQKAETYETLDRRHVDARWNSMAPPDDDRTVEVAPIEPHARALTVQGIGLGVAAGETVLFIRLGDRPGPGAFIPRALTVDTVKEADDGKTTVFTFVEPVTGRDAIAVGSGQYRLLAKPALDLRLFGWNADPRIFPPEELHTANKFVAQAAVPSTDPPGAPGTTIVVLSNPNFGYDVFGAAPAGTSTPVDEPDPRDLYLADPLTQDLVGRWVVRVGADGSLTPYFVTLQTDLSVSFVREQVHTVIINPPAPTTTAAVRTADVVPQWISASTTRLQVVDAAGTDLKRDADGNDLRSRWQAGWALELRLQEKTASLEPVVSELVLAGDLTGLEPGMLVVLTTQDGARSQLVELTSIKVANDLATTKIVWKTRGPEPDGGKLAKSEIDVLGNVIRVSHGKAVNEVLGDSDGVTPFLRFALKKAPVTQLPDASGAVPALEVRVSDVLWTRVEDFAQSGPDDRHYLVQRNEAQVTSVLFGDGRRGAIPPSGRRHIKAHYRVGLGVIGNVEAGRLSRIEKAHPLVDTLVNPLPIAGGAEPAAVEQVRQQSTRFIRTFDRAVSPSDYADLALLFPGVARTQATSSPTSGVVLVVADAEGNPLGDIEPFKAFLDARRDRSVPMAFRSPKGIDVFVTIEVELDPAFFAFQVEENVRKALIGTALDAPGLFTFRGRQLGEPGHLSRLYQAVNAAAGVVFSQVVHFDLVPDPASNTTETVTSARHVRDVIQVAPHEWLRLRADNLSVRAVPRKDE